MNGKNEKTSYVVAETSRPGFTTPRLRGRYVDAVLVSTDTLEEMKCECLCLGLDFDWSDFSVWEDWEGIETREWRMDGLP